MAGKIVSYFCLCVPMF